MTSRAASSAAEVGVDGLEWIASGGSADVFRGRDLASGREVAVKVLRSRLTHESWPRLDAEVEAMRRMGTHPHVLTLHRHEVSSEGYPVLVLELCASGALWQRSARQPLSSEEVVSVAADTASVLAAAVERGLVHGDMTPANLLVGDDGHVRVADFGLAGLSELAADARPRGATAGLAAPEVLAGEPSTSASDAYGLAASLWALHTGDDGLGRSNPAELPTVLRNWIVEAMSDDPASRPTASDLLEVLDGEPSTAVETGDLGEMGTSVDLAPPTFTDWSQALDAERLTKPFDRRSGSSLGGGAVDDVAGSGHHPHGRRRSIRSPGLRRWGVIAAAASVVIGGALVWSSTGRGTDAPDEARRAASPAPVEAPTTGPGGVSDTDRDPAASTQETTASTTPPGVLAVEAIHEDEVSPAQRLTETITGRFDGHPVVPGSAAFDSLVGLASLGEAENDLTVSLVDDLFMSDPQVTPEEAELAFSDVAGGGGGVLPPGAEVHQIVDIATAVAGHEVVPIDALVVESPPDGSCGPDAPSVLVIASMSFHYPVLGEHTVIRNGNAGLALAHVWRQLSALPSGARVTLALSSADVGGGLVTLDLSRRLSEPGTPVILLGTLERMPAAGGRPALDVSHSRDVEPFTEALLDHLSTTANVQLRDDETMRQDFTLYPSLADARPTIVLSDRSLWESESEDSGSHVVWEATANGLLSSLRSPAVCELLGPVAE